MEKPDFMSWLALPEECNIFLIDWLTFVAHGETVDYIKWLLGLDSPDIPWEVTEKFRNGYPLQCYWNGITISYGADYERYYKDPSKVRLDMGICVNLSGTGCRAFESYGHGDWMKLFSFLFRDVALIASEQHKFKKYNITRLDLAYDDHIGILDIYRIERDTRDRNYVSKSRYTEITWSDNQDEDLQGLTVQVGSDKSDVKIRIYNKAAERGYKDKHWIRVEMQLRDDRAFSAVEQILKSKHIGRISAGILRNYLTYREPVLDTNKSRWPLADYWDKLLMDMEVVRLWKSPGEPYNISKTEYYLIKQYGQAIVALDHIRDDGYLIDTCKKIYPLDELAPKYKRLIHKFMEGSL